MIFPTSSQSWLDPPYAVHHKIDGEIWVMYAHASLAGKVLDP